MLSKASELVAARDIIKSINGKMVTEENICELQMLLIENRESWEGLNVVVY